MATSPRTTVEVQVPTEGRCGYFVERKKRFCRMVTAAGRRFCGEHAGAAGMGAEEENIRKRILCPLDPKHTVYEDQLEKHLKKCNSREKPKPDYFIQDINAGLKDETEILDELVPISSLSEEQLENLIKKLRKASNSMNCTLKEQIMSHPALHDVLNDPKNGDSAFKHLKQQAGCLAATHDPNPTTHQDPMPFPPLPFTLTSLLTTRLTTLNWDTQLIELKKPKIKHSTSLILS